MATKALPPGANKDEIEDATVIDGDFQDISDLQGDIDDTLNSIKAEFDADENDVKLFMKVYRVIEKTGTSAWLFNCSPEELPIMEKLRDEYGGGIYQVRVYKNKKLSRRFQYQIEAPKTKPVSVPAGNPPVDIAALINAITQQSDRNFQQMKDLVIQMQARPASAGQAFDIMGMINAVPPLLVAIKALMPQQQDTSVVLLKALEIGASMGGGGKETNFLDIAKEAIGSIGPLIASQLNQPPRRLPNPTPARPPANTPVKIPAQSPAQTTVQPPKTDTENGAATMDLSPLKPQVDMLVKKALSGADPALYADLIADNVPAETIKQYLLQDSLLADLKLINPRVAECEAWFLQLKNELLQIFAPGEGETLTPEGDNNDTSSDALNEPLAAVVPHGNPSGDSGG